MPDTEAKTTLSGPGHVTKTMTVLIWCARITLAAVFIFSGISKAIDPWGFVFKLQDYASVWDLTVPRTLLLCFAVALSAAEFVCGVLMATGSLRRVSLWCMGAMMAVMLPLTAYLAIANPVPDCGCFGDAMPISNAATFAKNIVIVAVLAWLWKRNEKIGGIVATPLQWMVIAVSLGYSVTLSYIGYEIQPVVDFRPFKTGTSILGNLNEDTSENIAFVYEKDGQRLSFHADALPDSSWTFVERINAKSDKVHSLTFFDGDEEVSTYEIEAKTSTPTLLLLVSDPMAHDLSRCNSANRLHRYVTERLDGIMFAVVACHPDSVEAWQHHVGAQYEAFSAEDTMLKEIARGDASLVYLHGDTIVWKRNILSLPPDFPPTFESQPVAADGSFTNIADENILETVEPVDDMHLFVELTLYFLLAMAVVYALKFAPGLVPSRK